MFFEEFPPAFHSFRPKTIALAELVVYSTIQEHHPPLVERLWKMLETSLDWDLSKKPIITPAQMLAVRWVKKKGHFNWMEHLEIPYTYTATGIPAKPAIDPSDIYPTQLPN
jgi:hypothetical protein